MTEQRRERFGADDLLDPPAPDTVLPDVWEATVPRVVGWGGREWVYRACLGAALPWVAAESQDGRATATVAAWRSGVVRMRTSALAAASGLDPRAAGAALGMSPDAVGEFLARQARSRFALPTARPVTLQVGGFRGVGGHLIAPPTEPVVVGEGVSFLSAGARWVAVADAFGAEFRRCAPEEAAPVPLESSVTVHTSADSYFLTVQERA